MAEVHIIGQITRALEFDDDKSLFVRWSVDEGSHWKRSEGHSQGQTHLCTKTELEENLFPTAINLSYPCHPNEDLNLATSQHWFNHPIDLHYHCSGLQGWPQFEFQVWSVDFLQRCNISAYGYLAIPMRSGFYRLKCATWRPVGDLKRRIVDYITGTRMQLINPSSVINNAAIRHNIKTQSMGFIEVELHIVLRDFEKYGIDLQ